MNIWKEFVVQFDALNKIETWYLAKKHHKLLIQSVCRNLLLDKGNESYCSEWTFWRKEKRKKRKPEKMVCVAKTVDWDLYQDKNINQNIRHFVYYYANIYYLLIHAIWWIPFQHTYRDTLLLPAISIHLILLVNFLCINCMETATHSWIWINNFKWLESWTDWDVEISDRK